MKTATFSISACSCFEGRPDAKNLEKKLKINPHIIEAIIDWGKCEAKITYMDEMLSRKKIESLLSNCGFLCKELPIISSKEALTISKHKRNYKKRPNRNEWESPTGTKKPLDKCQLD